MRICPLVCGIFQLMCARHTDLLAAVLANLYTCTVALILIFLMLMWAALDHAAAMADILCRAIRCRDRLIAVMNRPAAVHAGNAVAHVIAVATLTCTDIPAVGQCVAERQRITVLQVIAGHGRTGVEVRTADGVHPAGTHCVIKLPDAGACAGQRDTIAVDAAPEDCFITACAEVTVNSGEDFILCTAELAPAAAECIRAAAQAGTVVHGFQIEPVSNVPLQEQRLAGQWSWTLCAGTGRPRS